MSTIGAFFVPDYQGSLAAGLIGTIASNAVTGVITLGKYRLFKVQFLTATTPPSANNLGLRFTLGITGGTTAPSPTATSPVFVNNQENIFELSASYDQINLANLSTDNGAITISYVITPLAKF